MATRYKPIYLGDNGRVTCLALSCAGATAHFTKRDLSGQPLSRITATTVRFWVGAVGAEPQCEGCGAHAAVLS